MATTEQLDSMMAKVAEIQTVLLDARAKRTLSDAAFAANNRSLAKWLARIESGDDPTTASMRTLAELRLADQAAAEGLSQAAGAADQLLNSKRGELDEIVNAIIYP